MREVKGRSNRLLPSLVCFFKLADDVDCFLMAIGCVGAIFNGLSQTTLNILFALVFNDIGTYPSPDFMHRIKNNALRFLYLGAASFVAAFLEGYCCTMTAERQAARMRARYLKAVMRQDVGYFNAETATAEIVNVISNDSLVIQDVLGEKAPNFIMNCSTFLGNYIVAFVLLWRLAVAATPSLLLLIVPGLIYGRALLRLSRKIQVEYDKAGAIVEQALSAIRTVYSSTAELYVISAFSTALDRTVQLGLRQDFIKGLAVGSNNVCFAVFAFLYWYGGRLVENHGAKGGTVVSVAVCLVHGGQTLGICLSNVKYLVEAINAMEKISEVIERRPMIDMENNMGDEIEELKGEVEFREVGFSYPMRPATNVFEGFNLRVEAGKKIALVGESGSGKSTTISLLQRFYDPTAGEILLDGVNIKKLRLNWLRAQMGLVSQEPVLFATSIKENILFGKKGATMEEVVAVAKAANADEFISLLPSGYDTLVGERGIQLSGGEKQRIAIARALIRSPKILLLDEATSALDTMSELAIQEALDVATIDRTTIIIAHRLSTIRNSDTIYVIQSGQVIESGSHNHLINITNGHYSYFLHLQELQKCAKSMGVNEANSTTSFSYSHRSHNFSRSTIFQGNCAGDKMENMKGAKIRAPSFWFLLLMNTPEWRHMLLGVVCAAFDGLPYIVNSYSMSSILTIYLDKDKSDITAKIRIYCLILLVISVLAFVVYVLKDYSFSIMGQYLTKRIREAMLSKLLMLEVGWFDQEENSTGDLCSKIFKDARVIQSLVGDRLSLMIQTLSTIMIAYTIGLVISWKLALVIISMQPIVIACYYTKSVLLKELSRKRLSAQSNSNRLAMEAIQNIRTITSFSSQDHILRLFILALDGPRQQGIQHSWFAGTLLGFSQVIGNCSWAISFWDSGILLSKGSITTKALLQTLAILCKTSRTIADAGAMTTDLTNGISSAAVVLSILERDTQIDPDCHEGHKADSIKGVIEFRNIFFSYPSRPEVLALKHFSISFEEGQSTALVGPSGSGKSTIIGLIQRFYDPLDGEVCIDGRNIQAFHLRSLRRHIALVGQEPTLFIGTIKENILYGVEDASDAEVEAAARIANAHDFICGLKDGYNTNCGEKGLQLSGGQKQRVAIARAILRNPSILLLDEATSALDGEAEKLVQEALERVMRGKTTVVVAHRLGTIKNCDLIVVLENGLLVEKGDHASLMEMNGKYFGLVNLQLRQDK
ncbi:putative multidrug resistance protein [Phalaenopsis equestris]|uniref:putative multidrug resistance protein n=1 Tax=Phalaenopsis equestris TaxID=78828 RepID=UPI0009E217AA|nr:putative multidrug resistance protein [Phalaenopsis equestris]